MEFFRTVVAKIFIFVLFGLLILSFAVWGIGDIFRDGTNPRVVAEVGEYQIDDLSYTRALSEDFRSIQRNLGGRFDMEQAEALGLPERVLQRLIADGLFSAEAADMKLRVSDEQAREAIFSEAALQDEFGRFSRERFEQLLAYTGRTEADYVHELKEAIKRRHVVQASVAGVQVPSQLANAVYRYREESRTADYISLPFSEIVADREPSEEELSEIHEEFSDLFMAPETRDLTVLSISPETALGALEMSDDDLRLAYEERLPDLTVPERRTLSQIVLGDDAAVESFRGRLSSGLAFAEAVRQESGIAPVALGKLSRSDLSITLPEAVDKVFAAESGEVVGPVKSTFGQHFILVAAIEEENVPTFESIKDRLAEDIRMETAIDEMIALANRTDDLLASGMDLETAAGQLGLALRGIERLDAQGNGPDGNPVGDLPSPERFLNTAFETEEGDQSLLTETEQGGYFLVRVDRVYEPSRRALEDVREEVTTVWRQLRRETQGLERAQEIAERINNDGVTLAAIAEGEGLDIRRGVTITRIEGGELATVSEQIFSAQEGDAVIGQTRIAALVAVMTGSAEADPAANEADIEELTGELQRTLQGDLLAMYSNALQERYGVTINETLVEQVVTSF